MPKRKVTLEALDAKLDEVLRINKSLHDEHRALQELEEDILEQEHEELSGLEKLHSIESEIAKIVGPHPLKKMTLRDLAQGTIGAFIGVLAHFTFIYGVKVAHQISMVRAIMLFPLSLIIGAVFLYATGFRRVPKRYLWYLPVRLGVLFLIAVSMATVVLFFFQPGFTAHFEDSFKEVATVTLMGLIGAITADLIGKEH